MTYRSGGAVGALFWVYVLPAHSCLALPPRRTLGAGSTCTQKTGLVAGLDGLILTPLAWFHGCAPDCYRHWSNRHDKPHRSHKLKRQKTTPARRSRLFVCRFDTSVIRYEVKLVEGSVRQRLQQHRRWQRSRRPAFNQWPDGRRKKVDKNSDRWLIVHPPLTKRSGR